MFFNFSIFIGFRGNNWSFPLGGIKRPPPYGRSEIHIVQPKITSLYLPSWSYYHQKIKNLPEAFLFYFNSLCLTRWDETGYRSIINLIKKLVITASNLQRIRGYNNLIINTWMLLDMKLVYSLIMRLVHSRQLGLALFNSFLSH